MTQLDRHIDALYQLPPSAFTAARTTLAKTLSGDAARRVSALRKPSAVPWAVNQVFWKARPIYDRVLDRGRALRTAQIAALKGRTSDVRAASETHRQAVADAVREGVQLAAQAGLKPSAEHLARMFEAVSLASPPSEEAGRFTDIVEPSGFEALAGVTPAGRDRAVSITRERSDRADRVERQRTKPTAVELAAERRAMQEKQRRTREAAARLRTATHALERARGRADAARRALERAEADVATAERRLAAARVHALKPIA